MSRVRTVLALSVTAAVSSGTTVSALFLAGFLATSGMPSQLADSCRLFMTAYDEAASRAKQQNDETLQTELAHPIRVSDVWQAKNQAMLDAAALKVQNMTGEWGNVAWQIVQAATLMDPRNLEGAAQKDTALSAAQAACVGR